MIIKYCFESITGGEYDRGFILTSYRYYVYVTNYARCRNCYHIGWCIVVLYHNDKIVVPKHRQNKKELVSRIIDSFRDTVTQV